MLCKRARFHNTNRWEANLPMLERTLVLDVSGNEGIKQSLRR